MFRFSLCVKITLNTWAQHIGKITIYRGYPFNPIFFLDSEDFISSGVVRAQVCTDWKFVWGSTQKVSHSFGTPQ